MSAPPAPGLPICRILSMTPPLAGVPTPYLVNRCSRLLAARISLAISRREKFMATPCSTWYRLARRLEVRCEENLSPPA